MNYRAAQLPKFWIGLSLLFWGVFSNHLAFGIGMAIIAEFGAYSPFKWELSDIDFYRVADLTSVLFAVIAIYQFNEYSIYGIYEILGLFPVCIFPLLVCERYSTTGAIPLSALFLSLRRRVRSGVEKERLVGVAVPYVIVCVLAASTSDMQPLTYLASALLLSVGALFGQRAKRYKFSTWAGCVVCTTMLAVAIQAGIRFGQQQLGDSLSYWVNQFAWFQTDPNRARTAIGSIGRLKLSDRIRVRLFASLSIPLPVTLHEASYSHFNLGTWSVPDNQFVVVDPVPDSTIWNLHGQQTEAGLRHSRIIVSHAHDVEVTPLPYGTQQVFGTEVIEIQQSRYGTTLMEASPGQFEYGVSWHANRRFGSTPTAADLSIPENYAGMLKTAAEQIGLNAQDPRQSVAKLIQYFSENYTYSLIQKGFYPGRTPLSQFLLETRQGHCEYFATATTLLLRHAGIPARYAVGYVVDEYSNLEGAFVARARDAHSWTEAFVDGQWISVDTTPSEWASLEQANASSWQTILDLWSWLTNRYDRFQRSERDPFADSLIWFVPPLTLWLIWRLRKQVRNVRPTKDRQVWSELPGSDSELYRLSILLGNKGFNLDPGETLHSYLMRNVDPALDGVRLSRVLELHYRYRFASGNLTANERTELRTGSEKYCRYYQ